MHNDQHTKVTDAFSDPRLVDLYDTLNPFADDTRFYLELASKLKPKSIVDIGCGTGLLTCELAKQGYDVTGIEPEAAMLNVARHRPGGEKVEWIEGYSTQLGQLNADLVLMTGHVAQVFLKDEDWMANLNAIYKSLRPGGYIAFESRNPVVSPWESWTPEKTRRYIDDPKHGRVETWVQFLNIAGNEVSYEVHYLFEKSGEELVSQDILKFRSQEELSKTLTDAGFVVQDTFDNWQTNPVTNQSPELIFIAHKK